MKNCVIVYLYGDTGESCANKRLVQTPPARSSFSIIARHKGFGGGFSAFLPLRAREAQYKRGVSALPCNRQRILLDFFVS
jgi:hypothetical protein